MILACGWIGWQKTLNCLPYSLASLICFGNGSIFEESLGSAPPTIIFLCMLAAVLLVYMPAMVVGTRLGVK